jgi:hypothetical protein
VPRQLTTDEALYGLLVPYLGGDCDASCSHSWHDAASLKWDARSLWCVKVACPHKAPSAVVFRSGEASSLPQARSTVNTDATLYGQPAPRLVGFCDVFFSHRWHADAAPTWDARSLWRAEGAGSHARATISPTAAPPTIAPWAAPTSPRRLQL